jgi:hypothetical protein
MAQVGSLNKADSLIAELMLAYPSLYPTREAALFSIFFSGNCHWKDGCVVRSFGINDYVGITDTSDLDARDAKWSGDETFAVRIRVKTELDRRTRLFRAENIEHFAVMNDGGYSHEDISKWNLNSEYNTISKTPLWLSIDAYWLAAAEDIVSNMKLAFNQKYGMHLDTPIKGETAPEPSMFSRMPEQLQINYKFLLEIEDKLEAQSGSKARMKAYWEKNGAGLMAEIKDAE